MSLHFLRSLFITGVAGILAPIVFFGMTLLLMTVTEYIPGLDELSGNGKKQVLHFLTIFGSGSPLGGVGVLATVSGSVAALFDAYKLLASSKPAR
jgi:hypothetical protein